MIMVITNPPCKTLQTEEVVLENKITETDTDGKKYGYCFIGPYSYCWGSKIYVAIENLAIDDGLAENFHVGNCCCIAENCKFVMSTNGEHNMKAVSLGGFSISMKWSGIEEAECKRTAINKGSIVIQNDVWIGDGTTVMGGVIVHNGAVLARESHVVKDVPPYAIVGGNPAKIIGYRFSKEIIEKLQVIQWWYWDKETLLANSRFMNENVEEFCEMFYEDAKEKFDRMVSNRNITDDSYFIFVDYYEDYNSFEKVIDEFLQRFVEDPTKRLLLFVRNDLKNESLAEPELLNSLQELTETISRTPGIQCSVEMRVGDKAAAKESFLDCSHYIISRTYDTVEFTCLADLLGIEIISGVDTHIAFEKIRNFVEK